MTEVRITVSENGPYVITGGPALVDRSGQPFGTIGQRLFLCRCGASTTKPFCDGTHSKIGFQAPSDAAGDAA